MDTFGLCFNFYLELSTTKSFLNHYFGVYNLDHSHLLVTFNGKGSPISKWSSLIGLWLLRVVNVTTEALQKYAINTVTIAFMDTNRKAIQAHHTATQYAAQCASKCTVLKVHNSAKHDVRSSEWDGTRCVTYT